jgi:hypothetical protein
MLPESIKEGILDSGSSNDFVPYKLQLLAYDDACFEGLDTLRPQTLAVLGNVIGFVFLRGEADLSPVCAAFRLSTQYVATAKHCLFWRELKIDPGRLEFRLLAAPRLSFHLVAAHNATTLASKAPRTDQEDYEILQIDTRVVPFKRQLLELRTNVPYKDYLLIPAFSTYAFWFKLNNNIDKWPAALRVDKSPSCVRFQLAEGPQEVRDRCILTQCQTLQSMSGSPIFGYDHVAQKLFIGGIHLRGGLLSQSSPGRECGNHPGFNVGVTLPHALIAVDELAQ